MRSGGGGESGRGWGEGHGDVARSGGREASWFGETPKCNADIG